MKSLASWKNKILSMNIPKHDVYLHVSMETPVIIKCANKDTEKYLAGTSNLQTCVFVAVKLTKGEDTFLGFAHHDGSEKSSQNLHILAQFMANMAGNNKDDIVVTRAQNIEHYLSGSKFAKGITDNAAAIFKEAGIHNLPTTKLLSSSRVVQKTDKNAPDGMQTIEPYQKASSLFPQYFIDKKLQDDPQEFYDDHYLKDDIKNHNRKLWQEFSKAESSAKQLDILTKNPVKYLMEERQTTKQEEIYRS